MRARSNRTDWTEWSSWYSTVKSLIFSKFFNALSTLDDARCSVHENLFDSTAGAVLLLKSIDIWQSRVPNAEPSIQPYAELAKMLYFSLAIACIVAWYATTISNKQAEQFINGPAGENDGVRPGSGQFFDSIASTYDLLNEVISLGYQRSWRSTLVSAIMPAESVLDVSTGTADLAFLLAAEKPVLEVVALDPSVQMLAIAQRKLDAIRSSIQISDFKLVEGTAEALPFEDAKFDCVTIAFGVRNFENRLKGLSEIVRVLRPGGRVAILELSAPDDDSILSRVRNFGVRYLVPFIAGTVSGRPEAYRYLADSMSKFPSKEEFERLLVEAGLVVQTYQRLPPFRVGPELYIASKPDACAETST